MCRLIAVSRIERSYEWTKEWPSSFASGESLTELTEALEEAVSLYITPDDKQLKPIELRIREMELELDADRPLIRARAEASDEPLAAPPIRRDPHEDWPLRGFHRRGEQ